MHFHMILALHEDANTTRKRLLSAALKNDARLTGYDSTGEFRFLGALGERKNLGAHVPSKVDKLRAN